jgi:hypothetical protein
MKHCPVADTCPCARIRGVQKRLYLVHGEVVDQAFIGFLGWDGANASSLVKTIWQTVFQELEERFDGSEPGISRFRSVVPFDLKVIQKGNDKGDIKLLKGQ